jgi:hypothetical protein
VYNEVVLRHRIALHAVAVKAYLIHGLAIAGAGAVLAIVLYLLGFHSDPQKLTTAQIIGTCGTIAFSAIGIRQGIRARRAQIPATEEFTYGQAFGAGFMVGLFAALFAIVTTYVYSKFINPEFVDTIVQAQVAKLEAQNVPADGIEAAEKIIRRMSGPEIQAGAAFIMALLINTIVALIVAAFSKRPAAPLSYEAPPPLQTPAG